jgi:hypothetical protein
MRVTTRPSYSACSMMSSRERVLDNDPVVYAQGSLDLDVCSHPSISLRTHQAHAVTDRVGVGTGFDSDVRHRRMYGDATVRCHGGASPTSLFSRVDDVLSASLVRTRCRPTLVRTTTGREHAHERDRQHHRRTCRRGRCHWCPHPQRAGAGQQGDRRKGPRGEGRIAFGMFIILARYLADWGWTPSLAMRSLRFLPVASKLRSRFPRP